MHSSPGLAGGSGGDIGLGVDEELALPGLFEALGPLGLLDALGPLGLLDDALAFACPLDEEAASPVCVRPASRKSASSSSPELVAPALVCCGGADGDLVLEGAGWDLVLEGDLVSDLSLVACRSIQLRHLSRIICIR